MEQENNDTGDEEPHPYTHAHGLVLDALSHLTDGTATPQPDLRRALGYVSAAGAIIKALHEQPGAGLEDRHTLETLDVNLKETWVFLMMAYSWGLVESSAPPHPVDLAVDNLESAADTLLEVDAP